jgi:hypothetical protein
MPNMLPISGSLPLAALLQRAMQLYRSCLRAAILTAAIGVAPLILLSPILANRSRVLAGDDPLVLLTAMMIVTVHSIST